MRRSTFLPTALAVIMAVCASISSGQNLTIPAPGSKTAQYGRLPLSFEANQGQTDPRVRFLSRGSGYSLFLTDSEAVLSLSKGRTGGAEEASPLSSSNSTDKEKSVVLMQLKGANAGARVFGLDQLPGKANYFIGNDPAKWRTGLPTYAQVKYEGVYPGIDLIYYGNQRQLEYDFAVAPGADPGVIRLRFAGAEKLSLSQDGDLRIAAAHGDVTLRRPVVYQSKGGQRRPVDGKFMLLAGNQVGFRIGTYDRSATLVIDPVLTYSTYLGGSNGGRQDFATAIAVDASGNAYVTGSTQSTDFPVTRNALQPNYTARFQTAFVTKFSADGSTQVYSTYFGGTYNNYGSGIAVDSSGAVYLTGWTGSKDFPTTKDAYQTALAGRANAFVTKLSADGSELVYSTFLGGSGEDSATGIAIDSAGEACVSGSAHSSDFPLKNALQSTNKFTNGGTNGFVTKLTADGTGLVFSTYLGGSGNQGSQDYTSAIAVTPGGAVYVTGVTNSTDFYTSPEAFQFRNTSSYSNAFVTAISASGNAYIYSTYFGGNYREGGLGIALDSAGDAYLTGFSASPNFYTTKGAYQTTAAGGSTPFVAKFDPTGSKVLYSTLIGGASYYGGGDEGNAIVVDSLGEAYISGSVSIDNFPVTTGAYQAKRTGNPNAFVTKFNSTGSALLYSTYFGGSTNDYTMGLALDTDGDLYLAGYTTSTDFPTQNAFQPMNNAAGNGSNAFVSKLDIGFQTTTSVTSSTNPQRQNFPVTFTARVTANFSDQIPTGNVVFTIDGGAGITVALDATGKATYSTSSLTPKCGGHVIAVSYSGDSNFLVSSASLTQTIVGAPASIASVSGTPQNGTYGSFFTNPLVIIVKDACSNPVFNTSVTFAGTGATLQVAPPPAPPATPVNPGTASLQVNTGSNGQASVYAYAATSGALSVSASVAGVTTPASLTLNAAKAQLIFTANPATAVYNQPLPQLTFTIDGFVNGDSASVLSGAPSLSTTATVGSPVGPYPIIIGPGTLAAANYTFSFVNNTLTMGKEPQTITFNPPSPWTVTYGQGPIPVSATSTCGLPVTLSVTQGPGVLNRTTLTITAAGTIIITANQAGNTNCLAAPATMLTIYVKPKGQTVTLTAPETTYRYPVKELVPLTARSTSGLPVSLRVISGPAVLVGNDLKIIGAGTVIVTATQLGNADYLPVTLKRPLTIDVKKGDQNITFHNLPGTAIYGEKLTLDATATSSLPVRFSALSGPGKISGDELRFIGAGEVVIAASQAGNANYLPAREAKASIAVAKAKLKVIANNFTIRKGQPLPAFTYNFEGFVNGDTKATAVTGKPKLITSATANSAPGTYSITISNGTLASKNYAFTFKNGTLTITK